MKIIIQIETKEGKTEEHECIDMPFFQEPFIILYKENLERLIIRSEIVVSIKQIVK